MKLILEKLDSSLFTDEMKSELQESFDIAVKSEAYDLVESKQADYTSYVESEVEAYQKELLEKVDSYLDQVVDTFVKENKLVIKESVKSAKLDAVLEGFNSLLLTTGIEVAQIAEATKNAQNAPKKLIKENAKASDKLMAQVIELKAQNAELLKLGLMKEKAEGLTLPQKEKFAKLCESIEFDAKDAVKFIDKLNVIRESVATKKVDEKVEDKKVVETKGSDTLVEKIENKYSYKTASKHLY